MAAGLTDERSSFAELTSAIVEDVQKLFKLELRLARHEVSEDLERAKQAGIYFAAAGGAFLTGLFLLALAVAQLLTWAGLPAWASSAIVGGSLLLGGWIALRFATEKAQRLGPEQTVDSVKENLQWIKRRV